MVRQEVKFKDKEMDVLYKPDDIDFPFWGMYYITKVDDTSSSTNSKNTEKNVKLVAMSASFNEKTDTRRRDYPAYLEFLNESNCSRIFILIINIFLILQ